MREFKNFGVGVAASAYFYLTTLLFQHYSGHNSEGFVFAFILLFTFVLFSFFNVIYKYLFKFKAFREILDKRSRYEGKWLLITNTIEDDSYGIASLHYDKTAEKFVFEGKSFDDKFNYISTYKSSNLFFNFDQNEILYNYTALTLKTNQKSSGLGTLTFSRDVSEKFDNVTDFFISMSSNKFNNYSSKLISIDLDFYNEIQSQSDEKIIQKLVKKLVDEDEN